MSGSVTTNPSTYISTDEDPVKYDIAKVLIIGDQNVGKGSVFHRYVDNEFLESRAICADFKIKNIIIDDKKAMKIQIWDQTRGERFRKNTPTYYKSTAGFIIVCDLSNKESYSINNISLLLEEIKQSNIINPPIVIILNKSDLLNTTKKDYQMNDELTELQKYCEQQSITLFKNASAKDDINIKESFDTLIKLIINKKDYPEGSIRHIDKTLNDNNNNNNNTNKSSCNIQ